MAAVVFREDGLSGRTPECVAHWSGFAQAPVRIRSGREHTYRHVFRSASPGLLGSFASGIDDITGTELVLTRLDHSGSNNLDRCGLFRGR